MSVSEHFIAFRKPDEKWKKMKAVYDAIEAAGLPQPSDVLEFFNYEKPDDNGVEIKIPTSLFTECGKSGVEVKVADIPPDTSTLRFYVSW